MGSRSTSTTRRSTGNFDYRPPQKLHDSHVQAYQRYLDAIEQLRLQEIAWRKERRWTWRNYFAWFLNKVTRIL